MPPEIELRDGPFGLRLRGPAQALEVAVIEFRRLKELPEDSLVLLGDWTLQVTERIPDPREPRVVSMPGHAWNIAASVLGDALRGDYGDGKTMDFREVGYLNPPADPDIGVEVVGDFAPGGYSRERRGGGS